MATMFLIILSAIIYPDISNMAIFNWRLPLENRARRINIPIIMYGTKLMYEKNIETLGGVHAPALLKSQLHFWQYSGNTVSASDIFLFD